MQKLKTSLSSLDVMPKLGFGMMRLPKNDDGTIDLSQLCIMVDAYMGKGLNYFDTAYPYHNGESEKVAGKALVERYPRDSFILADKMPAWFLKSKEDVARIFNEQLERTGAGHFASTCTSCGQCEDACPQHLPLIEVLQKASEKLDKTQF